MRTACVLDTQATAICRFLHHAHAGKHRGVLREFLVRYYSGDPKVPLIHTLFGISAQEFGNHVHAHSVTMRAR